MFGQVTPRSFLWLVSIWVVLTIGITGCGGDSDDGDGDSGSEWAGTWSIESLDGQNYEAFWAALGFSIVTNSWTFHDDGTWEAELTLEGLAAVKSMGTYSLSGSNYTATGLSEALDRTGPNAGTWSRTGNTLTITGNDGTVIVLTKK